MIEKRRTRLERMRHRRPVDLHKDIVNEPSLDVDIHALIDDIAALYLGEERFDFLERVEADSRMKLRPHDPPDLVGIKNRPPPDMGAPRFGGKAYQETAQPVIEIALIECDRPESINRRPSERDNGARQPSALVAKPVGQVGRVARHDLVAAIA